MTNSYMNRKAHSYDIHQKFARNANFRFQIALIFFANRKFETCYPGFFPLMFFHQIPEVFLFLLSNYLFLYFEYFLKF